MLPSARGEELRNWPRRTFPPTDVLPPVQRAYTSMVHLHDVYGLHRIFQPGFPGMLECFHVQEQLVKLLMPDVHEVFVSFPFGTP